MEREQTLRSSELEPIAKSFTQVFIRRWDLYPKQLDDGSYVCIRKPLNQSHILAHLQGEITLGTYLLDQENQTRFIVLDADDDEQMEGLFSISRNLASEEVSTYLEQSRRGGHLWLFFTTPVLGGEAREFGNGLTAAHGLEEIELYPKQDTLQSGPGSLIRLPFGIHRKSGEQYGFINTIREPIAGTLIEQIHCLSQPGTISKAVFSKFRELGRGLAKNSEFESRASSGANLLDKIKSAAPLFEFVGEYVQLSENGKGLCPFHDDKQASFSINIEENYWHCFAGCGGGSVIDFWMKWRGCEFTTAVDELAQHLEILGNFLPNNHY